MNTYLIPVTEPFGYRYTYFACVYASTPKEAYHKAKQIPDIDLYFHMVNEDPSTYIVFKDIEIPVKSNYSNLPRKMIYYNQKTQEVKICHFST